MPTAGKAATRPRKSAPVLKSQASRQHILEHAAKLFRDQGYASTTLRQIADAAHMKAGSIYYYFDSKAEILDAVFDIGIRSVFDAVRQRIDELPPQTGSRRRIEVAAATHLDALLRLGDFTSANIRIYGQAPAEIRARNRKLRRKYADYWSELLAGAQAAGEIRPDVDLALLRLIFLGALNWTVEWYQSERGPVEEVAKAALTMLFDGISKKS